MNTPLGKVTKKMTKVNTTKIKNYSSTKFKNNLTKSRKIFITSGDGSGVSSGLIAKNRGKSRMSCNLGQAPPFSSFHVNSKHRKLHSHMLRELKWAMEGHKFPSLAKYAFGEMIE